MYRLEPLEVKDYNCLLKNSEVKYSDKVKRSPICIDIVEGVRYIKFASYGNFSAIVGRQKSRKTFFVIMLLAAAIKGIMFGKLRGSNENKKTILFDTEQSKYDVHQIVKKVIALIETDKQPENFCVFSLKPYSPDERIEIINHYLRNNKDIGFVAIDGIRDLVSNINDPDEGTKLITYLNKWVDELNIHITVVLHVNKADEKPRGHIGTEIQNRAESVIIIRKVLEDKNISIVEPQDFRGIEFSPFAFRINGNGLPYIDYDYDVGKDEASKF